MGRMKLKGSRVASSAPRPRLEVRSLRREGFFIRAGGWKWNRPRQHAGGHTCQSRLIERSDANGWKLGDVTRTRRFWPLLRWRAALCLRAAGLGSFISTVYFLVPLP